MAGFGESRSDRAMMTHQEKAERRAANFTRAWMRYITWKEMVGRPEGRSPTRLLCNKILRRRLFRSVLSQGGSPRVAACTKSVALGHSVLDDRIV